MERSDHKYDLSRLSLIVWYVLSTQEHVTIEETHNGISIWFAHNGEIEECIIDELDEDELLAMVTWDDYELTL